MKTLKICSITLLFLVSSNASARRIYYTYDAAGNRIKRDANISIIPDRPILQSSGDDAIQDYGSFVIERESGSLVLQINDFRKGNAYQLYFFTINGRNLLSKAVQTSRVMIDTSNLAPGDYIVQLVVNGKINSYKYSHK